MKENDMQHIVELIDKVIGNFDNEDVLKNVHNEVKEFTSKFKLFAW